MTTITTRNLRSTQARTSPYFIRDNRLKGFAVKVNTSGSIKFIAEVWHNGKSIRKNLGEYPMVSVTDARQRAISFINKAKQGNLDEIKKQQTLIELFEQYMNNASLKPNTIKNYRHVILFYPSDWLSKFVSSISKEMVKKRFYKTRDKGINGRKPRLSQAVASIHRHEVRSGHKELSESPLLLLEHLRLIQLPRC